MESEETLRVMLKEEEKKPYWAQSIVLHYYSNFMAPPFLRSEGLYPFVALLLYSLCNACTNISSHQSSWAGILGLT